MEMGDGDLLTGAKREAESSRRTVGQATQGYAADDNAGVQKYPFFSPFGIDGGFYYARAGYRF